MKNRKRELMKTIIVTKKIVPCLGAILAVVLTALAIFSIFKFDAAVFVSFVFAFAIILVASVAFFYLFKRSNIWELFIAGTLSLMIFALLVTLAVFYPNIGINGYFLLILIPILGIFGSLDHMYNKEEKHFDTV